MHSSLNGFLYLTAFYPIKENDCWKLEEPLLMRECEKARSLQTLLSFISLTSGSSSLASLKAFFPLIFPGQAHKLSSLLFDQRWDQPEVRQLLLLFFRGVFNLPLRTPQTYKSLENLSIHCQRAIKKHMEKFPHFRCQSDCKGKTVCLWMSSVSVKMGFNSKMVFIAIRMQKHIPIIMKFTESVL